MVYNFTTSCSKERLKDIRDFVREALNEQKINEVIAHQIILAVDEICANLMIHSHQCNPNHFIEVLIKVSQKKQITIDIMDEGMGFDISRYKEPQINSVVKRKRKGGIGLMLVRRIMDKVEFISSNKKNICRLHKTLKPTSSEK